MLLIDHHEYLNKLILYQIMSNIGILILIVFHVLGRDLCTLCFKHPTILLIA